MRSIKTITSFLRSNPRYGHRLFGASAAAFALTIVSLIPLLRSASAQTSAPVAASPVIRIGEKLTYSISFAKIQNGGVLETQVVSRGRISGKEAVEIRGRAKTLDMVSAAFLLLDESRTTFAAPDTLLPHYVTTSTMDSVISKEAVRNYLTQPATSYDFLTLLYKAREAGGVGTFSLSEGDQTATVTFAPGPAERVRTLSDDFDTSTSIVQSELLAAHGIKDLRINFSTDEFRVPVLFRAKTSKGEFRAILSAISLPEPIEAPTPGPTPSPTPTPKAASQARPTPTPIAYVDNEPLPADIGFELGEVLDYRITTAGKPAGMLTLTAKERKLFDRADSLLITAAITSVEAGITAFRVGDTASVQVDPETLAPARIDSRFAAGLAGLNQSAIFDRRKGLISYGNKGSVEAPIGTQSFLSLIYAMRSFNLKPSKDSSNPVNDTRVSVFWDSAPHVFTLRPADPTQITINGEKISAQLINIKTLNRELDALNLRVWLRADDRVPVKFAAGIFEAELVSSSNLFRR